MTNWSEGYTKDITYTAGYYDMLNHNHIMVPLLMANLQPPKVVNACELGFGFGVSVNIHAAAGDVNWYGTDFNPSHALFAQHIANQVNPSKVFISDQAFAEFCQRPDLPSFDFIALHGIWSWISPQNREIILDFIRRKLNVGGVVYISYNTLPGWASKSPVRHLLNQYYPMFASGQGKTQAVKQALEQTKNLISMSKTISEQAPHLLEYIDEVSSQNSNYVIHEYLNQDWQPMYFSEIEALLQQAKLNYACSANYLDDFEDVLFTEEQQKFMADISDVSLKQTTKDFMLNKQFRRDYWVKGKLPLTNAEVEKAWRKLNVVLINPSNKLSNVISRHLTTTIKEEFYQPVIEKLTDRNIHSLDTLCNELKAVMKPSLVFHVIALLVSRKDVFITQAPEIIEQAQADCDKLNQVVLDNAFSSNSIYYLASPVIGGGIVMNRIELLFVSAYKQKMAETEWESFAYEMLALHNQRLLKEGKELIEKEDVFAELSRLKQEFIQEKLDMLKILRIIYPS